MCETGFIAYYRVSTARQGQSGLGLEAQKAAVDAYVAQRGGKVIQEYTEVESGKVDDRTALLKALGECRLRNATLLIAKLDRLSRNAAFLINLESSKAKFTAVDMPEATTITIGIMALVAQNEREAISARTKAALAARKARGLRLGTPGNLTATAAAKGREMGNQAKSAMVATRIADLAPVIRDIQAAGKNTLAAIAGELNARGFETARGGTWSPVQVMRVMNRMAG